MCTSGAHLASLWRHGYSYGYSYGDARARCQHTLKHKAFNDEPPSCSQEIKWTSERCQAHAFLVCFTGVLILCIVSHFHKCIDVYNSDGLMNRTSEVLAVYQASDV